MNRAKYVAETVKASRKYAQLLNSANRRGIEFSLTFTEVKALTKVTKCYYTGETFDPSSEENKASIDRIDASKGYVTGNVVVCCKRINNLKSRLFEDENNPAKSNFNDVKALMSKL